MYDVFNISGPLTPPMVEVSAPLTPPMAEVSAPRNLQIPQLPPEQKLVRRKSIREKKKWNGCIPHGKLGQKVVL